MNKEGWPKFSFTDLLKPPDGWRTDHAILSTYSADLVVIVTSLLAMSGCDLESRRTGSRVELVRAIEALRGRVRILAQEGRVPIPAAPVPILKLLDKFLSTVVTTNTKARFIRRRRCCVFITLMIPMIVSGGSGSAAEILPVH